MGEEAKEKQRVGNAVREAQARNGKARREHEKTCLRQDQPSGTNKRKGFLIPARSRPKADKKPSGQSANGEPTQDQSEFEAHYPRVDQKAGQNCHIERVCEDEAERANDMW